MYKIKDIKKFLLVLPAVLLVSAACNNTPQATNTDDSTKTPPASSYQQTDQSSQNTNTSNDQNMSDQVNMVKIALTAQNNSGENGSVTIVEVKGKAKVMLNISGAPATTAQPAHIHFGSCSNLGAVRYPLTNVSKGISTTTLDVSLSELISQPFAINVHKSATDINTYVSCGDSLKMNKTHTDSPETEK